MLFTTISLLFLILLFASVERWFMSLYLLISLLPISNSVGHLILAASSLNETCLKFSMRLLPAHFSYFRGKGISSLKYGDSENSRSCFGLISAAIASAIIDPKEKPDKSELARSFLGILDLTCSSQSSIVLYFQSIGMNLDS